MKKLILMIMLCLSIILIGCLPNNDYFESTNLCIERPVWDGVIKCGGGFAQDVECEDIESIGDCAIEAQRNIFTSVIFDCRNAELLETEDKGWIIYHTVKMECRMLEKKGEKK